jgi:hypothetical protein
MLKTMPRQAQFEDDNAEYAAFVEKFKPKKTTDDCYTPPNIYDAIAEWAAKKYGFDREKIVRPFWPGGDFTRFDYPPECIVLDNPPFSILSKIIKFYHRAKIPYFLFAPGLTQFSAAGAECDANYVAAHCNITYENGANVRTSFTTSMGDYIVETAPDLYKIVDDINKENLRKTKKELPKYEFPDAVLTAARCGYMSVHGETLRIKRGDACFIRKLDAMAGSGSGIFGGGFLLSERAATERAAAERAATERAAAERADATRWQLSPREIALQKLLGDTGK